MKAQDYKDIKTSNADTAKVIANNEIWWEKAIPLEPVYEFYDFEIGNNNNWSQIMGQYYYLNKFKGQNILYVRNIDINNNNPIYVHMSYGLEQKQSEVSLSGNLGIYVYSKYLVKKSEELMFAGSSYNYDILTKVFLCPEKYDEDFYNKLIEKING